MTCYQVKENVQTMYYILLTTLKRELDMYFSATSGTYSKVTLKLQNTYVLPHE